MLAFMLISAIAFSAYMRYARLPSSFLRRSSASRLLVKAALAEAIDEIDAAIGDNPYPGVGTRQSRVRRFADDDGEREILQNAWKHRVYVGTNELYSSDQTVSTLTLEGLAYIPPAIVNEARYYSRRSQAGIWKNLGFDAGRYAFCAIDVSDHFDVNALSAKFGRSSSPAGRISLAYLFENDDHTKIIEGAAQDWDDNFMEKTAKAREKSSAEAELKGETKPKASTDYLPFVSVADLNLALHGATLKNGWQSPFCQYIEQNGGDFLGPCGVTDPIGPAADLYKRMSFVTDGWFPTDVEGVYTTSKGNEGLPLLDLQQDSEQPFQSADMARCDSMELETVIKYGDEDKALLHKGAFRLKSFIGGIGLAMLYDYLDKNNVPLSLAIPSAERAPAVVGIQLGDCVANVKIEMKSEPEGAEEKLSSTDNPGATLIDETHRTVEYTKTYTLNGAALRQSLQGISLKALVAFPFPHKRDKADSFKLDGHLSLFFSSEAMPLRVPHADGTLHIRGDNSPDLPRMISGLKPDEQNVNGVFHLSLGEHTLTFPERFDNDSDAVQELDSFNIQMQSCLNQVKDVLEKCPLLVVTWQHVQEAILDEEGKVTGWKDSVDPKRISATTKMSVLNKDGAVDPVLRPDVDLTKYLADSSASKSLNLNLAVAFRVKNEAAQTVDLVPACMADDEEHIGVNNVRKMHAEAEHLGDNYPLMPFSNPVSGPTIVFHDKEGFDKHTEVVQYTFEPKAVACLDPRWNWAPEHWFRCNEISKGTWVQKCSDLFKRSGAYSGDTWYRDRDIFLASSDAGYLQSVYELAFLPMTKDFAFSDQGDTYWAQLNSLRGLTDSPRAAAWAEEQDFVLTDDLKRIPNSHLMWRSYWPFRRRDLASGEIIGVDGFDDVNMVMKGNGFKVNPYSPETNILMAAFANTPYNWWAASLNPNEQTGVPDSDRENVDSFNKKYCFNELSGSGPECFAWSDLKNIASTFIRNLRSHANDENWTWEDSFDWLSWSGNQNMEKNNDKESDEYKDHFCCPSTSADGGTDTDIGVNVLDGKTCDLYDIDRKFLYGYWRECFASKQQLFLVFVRAEPMMMGGGAAGATPPQLGARAVALVWRDPKRRRANVDNEPHKTRVLFYRQFD